MNCRKVSRGFSAYLDEKCSANERMAIGLHMSRCWACRERYAEMRRFRLAMLSEAKAHVPAEFSQAWRAGIRREQFKRSQTGKSRSWLWRFSTLAPVAACLVLIAAGAVLLNRLPWQKQGFVKGPVASNTQPQIKQPDIEAETPSSQTPAADQTIGGEVSQTQQKSQRTPDRTAAGEPFSAADGTSPGLRAVIADSGQPEPGNSTKTGTASGQNTTASVQETRAKGSWRVWLASSGDNPQDVQAVLTAAGTGPAQTSADGSPVVLRDRLDYSSASELSQRLEDAGGHTIVEYVPQ